MEDCMYEASKILSRAERLQGEARIVFQYFLDNISVGDLRAIQELRRKGVEDPLSVMIRLVLDGLLEKKGDVFNLPKPVRCLIEEKGPIRLRS
ncbi:MAG: hypothetical protein F7B18_07195 [Desulfurococcales archaeon]|nr:hypothetical protein [Desulfurococcales archaeon]